MANRKKYLVDTSVLIALFYNMELLTFNKKDFEFIQGVSIHPLSK